MIRIRPLVLSGTTLLLCLLAPVALAKEESKSKAAFENTGVEPDAEGSLKMKFQTDLAQFQVKLKDLTPDSEYTLRADGVDQVDVDTDSDGRARIQLAAPEQEDAGLLGFDPRDKVISIHDGDEDVLVVDLSDPSSVDKLRIKERTELDPTELAEDGQAEVRLKHLPNGKQELTVQTKHALPGEYDVCIDGVDQGSFDVNSGGSGKIIFKSNAKPAKEPKGNPDAPGQAKKKKKVPLDFDPFATDVELKRDGEVHFSGDTLADIPGFNECEPEMIATDLEPTNGGSSEATLDIEEDCKMIFTVSVEDVEAGDYDVFVDDVFIGTIAAEGDPASGSVTSETDPENNDAVPLTVDPRGKLVEVFSGDTLAFEGIFPEA